MTMASTGRHDLREILERALGLAAPEIEARARLVRELEPVPPVVGDPARLVHALFEILVATAKALPEGPPASATVRVALKPSGPSHVAVEVHSPSLTHAPDDPRLSRARDLLGTLGGELRFEVDAGRGTRLHVLLLHTPAVAPAPPAPSPSGQVLVVEDDADVAEVIGQALKGLHRVTWLADANEALARIAEGDRYDVILCDLMMPELDGMGLHAAITRVAPELAPRMVFMSGSTFFPRGSRFLAEIDNHFLEKPFSIRTLRALVLQVMRETESGGT